MKLKLLVIVYKNETVNKFLNFVHTARHAMGIKFTWRAKCLKVKRRLKWSRNKVAVGEPVAGINKFFLLFQILKQIITFYDYK